MKRSKRIIITCHCILNSNSKVEGLAEYPGALSELVKLIIDEGIGIIQLPCPELTSCGIKRWGMVKEQYDTPYFRDHCRKICIPYLQQLQDYIKNGYEILGIIGIDGSPSCGVNLTCLGDWGGELSGNPNAQSIINSVKMMEGKGVFIEELMGSLTELGIEISFLAIDESKPEASFMELEGIIRRK